ncbi:MAG: epoxyqueuosine reductase [Clostridiales bacterium]|nr:epoxyqueuosine reductase [Clostridiales bacterium]
MGTKYDFELTKCIEGMLFDKGAGIVRFVDISGLPVVQTQGFATAVVFCVALSEEFIVAVYKGEQFEHDEFVEKEHETDAIADWLADYLRQKGHEAYSQSEKSHLQSGNYDEATHTSILPHKTIARLAGIGYIGKNNLLITEEYGCGFSMCTVLTNAPIEVGEYSVNSSQCGKCDACKQVCSENAITGNEWSEANGREWVVDVYKCTCALKCMVNCPKTLKYALHFPEIN